jgi:hypothetical protein
MKTILSSRKQRYLAKFSIFFITVALIAGMVGCTEPSENLDIKNWYDLNKVRGYKYRDGHHKLMNNLDEETPGYIELASSEADKKRGWEPIGTSIAPFKGSFDGQNYTIKGLFIHRPREYNVGLFSSIAKGGVIKNVKVVDVTVTGGWGVGGLVGENQFEGTVSNSFSSGNVTGNDNVGGLVGENYGTVSDVSRFRGSVTSEEGSYIGGLVGKNAGGTVSDAQSTGSVSGNENVGGLVGENYEGNVSDSYTTCSVSGNENVGGLVGENYAGNMSDSQSTGNVNGNDNVGGLVGFNNGTVSTVNNSSSSSKVTGSNEHVGGLVGWNDGTVSNSYSTGSVTGESYVGGLVGENYGTVSDVSHFTGNVTSEKGSYIGGLVGKNNGGTVSDSQSTGSVSGENGLGVGGLVGNNYKGTVSNSYSKGSVTGENVVGVGGLVGNNYKGTVSNSYYNYDEVLINGENIITIGALFGEDFDQWLYNDKFLDIKERLFREAGYYEVNNVTDFKELLAFGQNGLLKFRLKTDLDLATEPNFYIPYLAGEFDGNGHKISNLSFNFDFVCNVGLFGYLSKMVIHVGVENVNITGASSVGGLVGYNWEGTVRDSYSTGSVTRYESYGSGLEDSLITGVGGLVGCNDAGKVENCNSTCSVTSYGSYGSGLEDFLVTGVGGLVGCNYEERTLENCNSTGSVTSYGSYGSGLEDLLVTGVGGLVGINSQTVRNSYSTGSVTGDNYVGGLVGLNFGPVYNSFSTGTVSGRYDVVGGLVGRNEADVTESFSTGTVSGRDVVGGLVGRNEDTVSNSYSTGNVRGENWIGGLVGYNDDDGNVNTTYSTGRVTSVTGDDYVGGLVGEDKGDVSKSFWDTETSGQATPNGGTGKTTAEMKSINTFITEWEIRAVNLPDERNKGYTWNIVEGETYPFLSWQPV